MAPQGVKMMRTCSVVTSLVAIVLMTSIVGASINEEAGEYAYSPYREGGGKGERGGGRERERLTD